MLTQKTTQAILELQKQYPHTRSALIPALHLAQDECGYLSVDTQKEVSELFHIDATEVKAVVTFYDMFHEEPQGKHVIHVCKNLSCMLRGSDELIEGLCQRLKTHPREISPDGEFTIIPSECLGACDRAPMMIVDDKVVGPVKEEDIDSILTEAKKGKGHPSSVPKSRINHG